MRLLIATRNEGKLAEISRLLDGMRVTILSAADLDGAPEVDEDQPTLEGNAIAKARTLHRFSGLPTLADDTGLEVDALGGRPGVHSARFAGPEADPVANRRLLLHELARSRDRRARFRCVVAYVDDHASCTFDGVCEGRILERERGTGGFGYDCVFVPDGHARTFAELPSDVKNAVSHRGYALRRFAGWLASRGVEN